MSVAKIRLAAAVLLGGLVACPLVADDEPREIVRPVTIVASPAILPQGAACRVELAAKKTGTRSSSCTVYEGTILKAATDGVRLAVAREEHQVHNEGLSIGLPFIDRFYKSSGVATVEPEEGKEVWVPAAKIESITLTETPDAE